VFESCALLESIAVPPSVEVIGKESFKACEHLRAVSFCSDSQLTTIQESAFELCASLESIELPTHSKLVRIERVAFCSCASLRSIFVPASTEFVGDHCFHGCDSLLALTFGSGSRLREFLDVPTGLRDFVEIPDSVEIIGCSGSSRYGGRAEYKLSFGRESRLHTIDGMFLHNSGRAWSRGASISPATRNVGGFLHFSVKSLKAFRDKLEVGPMKSRDFRR
jgi:hypothetical protein